MLRDDLLQRHERRLRAAALRGRGGRRAAAVVDGDEPRQQRRHLDAGEVLLARQRVRDDDRQVERQPRDVRERVRRVHRQRREHGEDLLAEELVQALLLADLELVPVHDRDALGVERGLHVGAEHLRVPRHQSVRALADRLQHLPRAHARRRGDGDTRGDAALQARHPHHEELVQVGREDREEPGALQQRQRRVLRQLQHPLVERQPAQLPLREPVVGQRLELGRGDAVAGLRLLGDVLGDVGRELRVQGAGRRDGRGARAAVRHLGGRHGGVRRGGRTASVAGPGRSWARRSHAPHRGTDR